MDKTESLTTNYGNQQKSQFEREKERLVMEINQGMDVVNRNAVQLNQNLESAISLGNSFDHIASLWSEFGTIINPPMEAEAETEADVDIDDGEESESIPDEKTPARDAELDKEGTGNQ